MPMTAEQLTEIADAVWAEIVQRKPFERTSIPNDMLVAAMNNSVMFKDCKANAEGLASGLSSSDHYMCGWVVGFTCGLELGKAVREVEELEGLGR